MMRIRKAIERLTGRKVVKGSIKRRRSFNTFSEWEALLEGDDEPTYYDELLYELTDEGEERLVRSRLR